MKILILVQSIDIPAKKDYARAQKAQVETWDSIHHPDVDVIYYFPGPVADKLEGNILRITCGTDWKSMFFGLAKAMRHMLKHDMSWDYIFKTDSSAYIDKALLHETLLSKSREKYYGGMRYPFGVRGKTNPDFMWGEGFALSRDMVAHVVSKYNTAPFKGQQEDDVVVAQLMSGVANWDGSLSVYVPMLHANEIKTGYHTYRCRIDHTAYTPAAMENLDLKTIIDNDIMMMHKIHNILTNGQANSSEGIPREIQSQT